MSDKAPSGYALEQAMSALMSARARLLDEDPELADDEAQIDTLLAEETADVEALIARMARAARHAEQMVKVAKDCIDTMRERQDRYKRRAETMRGALLAALDALGKRKVELPDMTISIGASSVSVQIIDADALPDRFVVTSRAPVKSAIAEALKAGENVPGACLTNGLPSIRMMRT